MAPSTRNILFALVGLTALGAAAYYIKTEILDKEEEEGEEGSYESEDDNNDDDDDGEEMGGASGAAKSREDMFSSISEANKTQQPQPGIGSEVIDTLEPPDVSGNDKNNKNNKNDKKKKKKKKSAEDEKKEEDTMIAQKEKLYDETCNDAKKALKDGDHVLAAQKYSQGRLCKASTITYIPS